MPTLTLIRGIPGSGKSTLAAMLASNNVRGVHYEADMFFVHEDGTYHYDGSKIQDAHSWCQNMAKTRLEMGLDVYVSNTFTKIWHMEPYLQLCRDRGYKLNVIECKGNFGDVHNVPKGTLLRMQQEWEEFPPQILTV